MSQVSTLNRTIALTSNSDRAKVLSTDGKVPGPVSENGIWLVGDCEIAPGGVQIISGKFATPESNVTAPIGSLYINLNGGASVTLWVKETGTGNTGWVAK